MVDPRVPAGTLVVHVVARSGAPIAGAPVTLLETIQNIAQGNTDRRLSQVTNASGEARFSGLDTSLRNSYVTRVDFDGGSYDVPSFRSLDTAGHRITVPVFPSQSDPTSALVGMRGFVYVMLREGEFVFDVLYRIFTMGEHAWVPQDVQLDLPRGATGVTPSEENPGFVPEGSRVRLGGTYPPGQKDVRFSFRIPSENNAMETFRLGVLPNVAELRVLAEAAPGMELRVPGFEPVQEATGPEGSPVLITRHLTTAGAKSPPHVSIELMGLPVIGPERWYAVIVAAALGLLGLVGAFLTRRRGRTQEEEADRKKARRLILGDLLLLEESHRAGEVGPQTYAQARRELLFALARLEDPDTPAPEKSAVRA